MLTLKCQGQQTTIAINEKIATDFISVNIVKFEFCERWKDMEKVAQFTQVVDGESKTYSVDIDELTNTAVMPNEVQVGELQISAFGVHPVSGVRITTIPAKITVEKSGYVGDGETPIPPTPDLYTQFIAKLSTLAKIPSVPGGTYRYELATDGNGGIVWEKRYLLPGERLYSLRGATTKKEDDTYKIGYAAVALGSETEASGETAFAAGRSAKATGACGVALGQQSKAIGNNSFATGLYAESNGSGSFAAGENARANGTNSVAVGLRCRADGESQFVFGKNNDWDQENKYAHIVGNGEDSNNRSNAHTLDWDGNAWYSGDVYVGGNNQDEGERLARMSDLENLGGGSNLPTGGEPHQMLVTDAEGNAKWEERIIRPPESNVVEVLPECTITAMEDMDGAALVLEPFAEDIIDGDTYTVYWNGTPYKTTSVFLEDDGESLFVLGDLGLISGGESTGEPFVMTCVTAEQGAMIGYYAMVMPLDGSTDIVLRIERGSMTYHPLTLDYLPEYMYGIDESKAVVRLDITVPFSGVEETMPITTPFALVAGMETIVDWNGVEYTCIAKEVEGTVVVGNLGLANKYPVTDEPFYISTWPGTANGIYGFVRIESAGLGPVPLTITQMPIRKVPEKFLPEGSVVEPITLTLAADGTFTADASFDDAYRLDVLTLSKAFRVYAPAGVTLGHVVAGLTAYFSVSNVFKGNLPGGYEGIHLEFASNTKPDSSTPAHYELWWYRNNNFGFDQIWKEKTEEYVDKVKNSIQLVDSVTGKTYAVTVADGKLTMEEVK